MKFLIDNNLSWRLTRTLKSLGHEASHVSAYKLADASDHAVWHQAEKLGAVVITRDADYLDLATQTDSGPSVLWLRIDNMRLTDVSRILESILPEVVQRIEPGARLVEYP